MSDEIRSLVSWDGTGKIYSEEAVQTLLAEIERLRDVLEEIRGVAGNKANPEADKAVIIGLVNDALNEEVRG